MRKPPSTALPRSETRAEFDARMIPRAQYFTACQFLGRGKYDVRESQTQEGAEAIAQANPGRWMIYAVISPAHSIHVKSMDTGPQPAARARA